MITPLNNYFEEIIATIDLTELKKIEDYILATPIINPVVIKYCNADYEIKSKLEYAINYLHLHERTTLDILDIGTAGGWFPYVCKMFNHNVYLHDLSIVNIDTTSLNYVNNLLAYDKILKLLQLTRHYGFKIEKNTPIKIDRKFDIITGLSTCFHEDWDMTNWEFFLNDIIQNLLYDNKETSIFFMLNDNIGRASLLNNKEILLKNKNIKNITEVDSVDKNRILINVYKE